MDLNGKKTLVFIEEDNVQRAYFRICPLLWQTGSLGADATASLPDDGYLRIVPDKNEQHTFKERMRSISPLCMLDLTMIMPEQQSKIRSNKNYSPDRGERNQYIVYSDAVKKLPDTLLYEVVSLENDQDVTERVKSALTPLAFVREGLRMTGPYLRATGELKQNVPAPTADSAELKDVTVPGLGTRLFYWPASETDAPAPVQAAEEASAAEKRAPAPKAPEQSDAPLELGKPLSILDETLNHEETLLALDQPVSSGANLLTGGERPRFDAGEEPVAQDGKLTGTPLYRTVAPRGRGTRPRNPLSALVEREFRAARQEPTGTQLKQGTAPRQLNNPVDDFRQSLSAAWHVAETHEQVLEAVLQMEGARTALDRMMHGADLSGAAVAAMRAQLQDMEAERLALLVQLSEAEKNVHAFRLEAISAASAKERDELASLSAKHTEAEELLAALKDDVEETARHLAKATERLPRATDRVSLRPRVGREAEREEIVKLVRETLGIDENEAIHVCLLLALCPQIQLVGALCNAELAARTLAAALGAAYCVLPSKESRVIIHPGDAPALLVSPIAMAPTEGITQLLLSETTNANQSNVYYRLSPWPSLRVIVPDWPFDEVVREPISMSGLRRVMLSKNTDLSNEARGLLVALCDRLELPRGMLARVGQYVRAASALMPGGVASALDYAVCAWFLPAIMARGETAKDMLSLLAGLPRSTQHMLES